MEETSQQPETQCDQILFDGTCGVCQRSIKFVNKHDQNGAFKFEPLEDITEAEFHRHFNTNVLGPILTAQEAVKHFGPTGGSVINIGSIASRNATPASVVYSATKSALETATRILARASSESPAPAPSTAAAHTSATRRSFPVRRIAVACAIARPV